MPVYELFFSIYVLAVLVLAYAAMRHLGLLTKSPAEQLMEKQKLMEQVTRVLHDAHCPLCGGKSNIWQIDLWKGNFAITKCEKCGQNALWRLESHRWKLVAPYRPVLKPQIVLETPHSMEKEMLKEEEAKNAVG